MIQSNPQNYTVYGQAVVTGGLIVQDGISGVGLVTNGFVWTGYDVWFDPQLAAPIVTSWSNSNALITTSWTDSNSAITTTWTTSQYGPYGEFEA